MKIIKSTMKSKPIPSVASRAVTEPGSGVRSTATVRGGNVPVRTVTVTDVYTHPLTCSASCAMEAPLGTACPLMAVSTSLTRMPACAAGVPLTTLVKIASPLLSIRTFTPTTPAVCIVL